MPQAQAQSQATDRTPLLNGADDTHTHVSRHWLHSSIDPHQSKFPLALQCLISGLADCISYSTSKTWVAFMTGNLTQVALASVDVLHARQDDSESDETSKTRLIFSGLSLLGFCLGAFLTSRFKSNTTKSRMRLVTLSLIHITLTTIVLLLVTLAHQRLPNDPLLTFLLALSMGSQSSASISLGSHPYSTTVVFTNPLTQLVSDEHFPRVLLAGYRSPSASGHRALSIALLLVGAVIGAVALDWIGVVGALLTLTGCQIGVLVAWATWAGENQEQ